MVPTLLSDEVVIRTGMRVYMDTWLGEPGRKRLRCALALATGSEAITSLKDAAGLDDDEEIIATLEWATSALLRTALHDFEESQ